jgi:hypothetical protein
LSTLAFEAPLKSNSRQTLESYDQEMTPAA